jgi:inner membrane protein
VASAKGHAVIAVIAGGGTYLAMCKYYRRQPSFGEFLVCAGFALVAGAAPDLLEPATHPHHRQLAHSFTAGGLLAKFALDKCSFGNCEWDQFAKIAMASGIAGYLSHLVADACTPRCLPLI